MIRENIDNTDDQMKYSVHIPEYPEYQESIFEKIWEPLQKYQHAQIHLSILDRRQPRPVNYELEKRRFEVQMLAAEDEMKKILYPDDNKPNQ